VKKILTILFTAILGFSCLAISCNTINASAKEASEVGSLVGKYSLVSWKNGEAEYIGFLSEEGINTIDLCIELRVDGTYTWDLSALEMGVDIGTYQVTNHSTLVLAYSGGEDILAIDGDRLIYREDDYALTFAKQREVFESGNSLTDHLVGEYVLIYWDDEGENMVDRFDSFGIDASAVNIVLRADGTYIWDLTALGMETERGKYTKTGDDTLLLIYENGMDKLYINGSTLYLYTSEGGSIIFEKTNSPIPVQSERWVMTYWRDTGSESYTHVYSDQLREQGIDTDEIYFEFRTDDTFTLNLSATHEYAGIQLNGRYKVQGSENTVYFDWYESNDAENFNRPKQADLLGDGDWFGIVLPSHIDQWANASFKKTMPTPPFSFKDSLPASARGVYALSAWLSEDGNEYDMDELFGGLRSDLAYIDFLDNGQFLLSLHVLEPGFFAWGTYWMDADKVHLEWEEDWDTEYFPFPAAFGDSKIYLRNAAYEVLVFDKNFGGQYPASAVSYRDGYFNSPLGSAKTLDGTVLVVSIYVYNDDTPQWSGEAMAAFRKYLQYSMQYLEEAAYEYGKELHFYQYQTDRGSQDLFYTMKLEGRLAGGDDSDELVRATRTEIDNFIEKNIPYLELADKYRTNNVTYVIFTPEFDRSYAWPYYADFSRSEAAGRYHEKSIIFAGTNYVLAHEILHTFGAVDLYQEEGKQARRDFFGVSKELMEYIEEHYPLEVMRRTHMHTPQLSPFTAYRLGWLDDLPELVQFPKFKLPGNMPGIVAEHSYIPKK